MKIVSRSLLVLLVLVVGVWLVQWIAAESGEVVVVTTMGPDGPAQTRLWIVDLDGVAYLRAGSNAAGWYRQMLAAPTVTVQRGETSERFTAVGDETQRAVVNALMREKYGWADAYISALFPRDASVPIRLLPQR